MPENAPPYAWLDRIYAAVGMNDEQHPRSKMAVAFNTLSQPEKDALALRYREGLTYEKAAIRMGVTRYRIHLTTVKALRKLRHPGRWNDVWEG